MRYWHPFADEAVEQMKQDGIEKLVILPLYPQARASARARARARVRSGLGLGLGLGSGLGLGLGIAEP